MDVVFSAVLDYVSQLDRVVNKLTFFSLGGYRKFISILMLIVLLLLSVSFF